MRNKLFILASLTLVLMGVLFMPAPAYANNVEVQPPGMAERPAAVPADTADEPAAAGKPFTPDGQATVVDHLYENDGKEFYTFETPAGNVFFLVIDGAREDNNVYFLNAVTENDLITLAEKDGEPIEPGAIPTPEPTPVAPETTDAGTPEKTAAPEKTATPAGTEPPVKKSGIDGTTIFIIIALLAVGGAGYYIKIVRPKQQSANNDEDEPEDDRDYPYEDDAEAGEDAGEDTDDIADVDDDDPDDESSETNDATESGDGKERLDDEEA